MKRQKLLLEIDDDKLRGLCASLPLKKPDQKIAYALAVLCSRSGAYAPDHGVGQSEIARLSGVAVRTVQRRIKFLTRYGILSIDRSQGRANVYQFDLMMLLDAPRPTNDIYKRIQTKADPKPEAAEQVDPESEPLPLFDQVETPAAPANELPSFLTRMRGAAGRLISKFTKRTFTTKTAISTEGGESTAAKPTPNPRQTTATISETPAKPTPLSEEPPPNCRQTHAKPPPIRPSISIVHSITRPQKSKNPPSIIQSMEMEI